MQLSLIKQRFTTVDQSIHSAAQAWSEESNAPDTLASYLVEWEQKAAEARQVIDQADSQASIAKWVDELEALGDKVLDACLGADDLDQELHDAIRQAHDAVSALKHQLH